MTESIIILSTILFAASIAALISEFLSISRKFCYISAGLVLSLFEPSSGVLTGLVQLSGIFVVFSAGSRLLPETFSTSQMGTPLISTVVRTSLVWILVSFLTYLLGFDTSVSVFAGFAASINSTAVAVGSIGEKAERRLSHARLAEASSFLDDIAAITFLGFIAGGRVGLILAICVLGVSFLLKSRLGSFLEELDASEHVYLFLGVASLLIFVSVSAGLKFGLAAGALAAGALFSQYPADVDVLESIKPLEAFFSSVFFVSLGSLYSFSADSSLFAALIFAGVAVLGPAVSYFSLRSTGISPHQSVLAALSLCSISEIVLLSLVSTEVFSGALTSGIILAALGSSLISSIYSAYSDRIYRLIESTSEHSDTSEVDLQDHVIVVGSGLIGRKVAKSFDETVVLENDKSKLEMAPEDSETLLGDARDDRAWSRCNVSDADKIISTVRSDSVAEKIATLDVEADKYALTGSKRDSSMLDLDIGVTQEELTEHKIKDKLGRGFDEGFEGLKKDLIKQLKDLT